MTDNGVAEMRRDRERVGVNAPSVLVVVEGVVRVRTSGRVATCPTMDTSTACVTPHTAVRTQGRGGSKPCPAASSQLRLGCMHTGDGTCVRQGVQRVLRTQRTEVYPLSMKSPPCTLPSSLILTATGVYAHW